MFRQKLINKRKEKGLSQEEVAKQIGSKSSIIDKYEKDEVKSTVDVVKKLTDVFETTMGYLLVEAQDRELFKDPFVMKRLNDISSFPLQIKNIFLFARYNN